MADDGHFPVTSWTLIRNAPLDPAALARLCESYHGPMKVFFHHLVRSDNRANDLIQEFLTEKIIGDTRLLSRADRKKGSRFRSYLKACMRKFYVDQIRKSRPEPLRETGMDFSTVSSPLRRAVRAYDREWASTVVTRTMERVKASCDRKKMDRQWMVFEARKIRPSLLGVEALPFDDVMKMIDARDRGEVDAILQKMNQKFVKTLRQVVAETIDSDDPADIDREIEQIKAALAP